MQHTTAFIWAGTITAAITTVVVLATGMFGVLPAKAEAPIATVVATTGQAGQQISGAEVRQRIAALDAKLRPQVQALQRQEALLAATAEQKQQSIESLQSQIAATQATIVHDDQTFAQSASDLQAQDAQARSMLEQATAELQVAYARLGVQPQIQGLDGASSQGSAWGEGEDDEGRGDHHE